MRIAITVLSTSSLNMHAAGNVQGDELIARAWVKALQTRGYHCDIFQDDQGTQSGYDLVIHFSLFAQPWTGTKNVLYFQNAFPPAAWPGGSVGQFNLYKDKFDAFLFTSERLRDNCGVTDRDTGVIPFAVDHDLFYPRKPGTKYAHPVVFVGNNIRGPEVNKQYLEPAIQHGLVIYGNYDGWTQPYSQCCHGKIPQGDEPHVYSSASICINCHLDEHVTHDTINFRIYCILACGGFVVSDRVDSLVAEFKDAVFFTDGGHDLTNELRHFLRDPDLTKPYREAGRELVLAKHTFNHRIDTLLEFITPSEHRTVPPLPEITDESPIC